MSFTVAAIGLVGGVVLSGLGGKDAPDLSGQNQAALKKADLSVEELAWAKQIYADSAPDRASATARANTISDAQLGQMNKQSALTDDYAKYNRETFRPLERGIVDAASNYDTEGQRELAAGRASADVTQSFGLARAQMGRDLTRRGVDPSSGAALAASSDMATQEALGLAGAANKARMDTQTQGYARKMDAASLGRNLPSAQATSAGIAVNQGNAAASNGALPGAITAQGSQLLSQGYAGAQQGLAGAASTYGSMASIQQKADSNDALYGAIGQVAGAYVRSDKNIKENRKPVSPGDSLAAVRKIPVESWKYKRGSPGDDGGKSHTGPMAQDVQKSLGNATAPGGKKIDLISMNGHTIGAIKALDQRLMRLEHSTKHKKAAP